jgi:hypothetical protein
VNNDLKRIWKVAAVVYLNVLFHHLPRETDVNFEKPQDIRCFTRHPNTDLPDL